MLRTFLATCLFVVGVYAPRLCVAQAKEPSSLLVGTLRHDGLLRPWAVFMDSTFRPVYGEEPDGPDDGIPWVRRSVADSVHIWYLPTEDGWDSVMTGELTQFNNSCMEYGFGYRTDIEPYTGRLNCPPWRRGNAFSSRIPGTEFGEAPGAELSRHRNLVGTILVDSVSAQPEGGLQKGYLEKVQSSVAAGKLQSHPQVASLEGCRVEFSDSWVWVSDSWTASVTPWILTVGNDTTITATYEFGDSKGSYSANPMSLIRYGGRYFILGEVWYWEGSDPAIWEIRNGRVQLLWIHREYRG